MEGIIKKKKMCELNHDEHLDLGDVKKFLEKVGLKIKQT